ncbi:M18 family aminopeptidase [Conyzicola sp.]|uniref:M18 family aminopeptidase n=1 Tax=Conyzicola sp. TaxID=1969404 RepID=UPI00398A16F7
MTDHLGDLAAFIAASPSSFHAAHEAARRLEAAGFARLDETHEWPDGPGRRFVVRDGAVIAWVQPEGAVGHTPFRIVGTHTDSPGLKLKPKPSTAVHGFLQAGVEVYGGPLYNSWLDRELEFAGRLVTTDGAEHLVRTGPFLRIPQLAVHLDRGVNEGLRLDPQQHLNPVYGLGDRSTGDVVGHLAGLAGIRGADVAGYDISVADTAPGAVFGLDGAFFAAGRMDNLVSVHAGLAAITAAPLAAGHVSVFAAFDHEEVGSETRSGAAGPFLGDVLARIGDGLGATESQKLRAFAASWCFSADAGHSVHPNYAERHDPANRPVMGRGPMLKINAKQRYATDAHGAAEWARACAAAGVAYQEFVSNNAVPCGSTIGPLTATRLGIRTVDVGIPLLSMHSARELCAVGDPADLAAVLTAFQQA